VYLECTDAKKLPGSAKGYRMDFHTWTGGGLRTENDVRAAFHREVAARLLVLRHLLLAFETELTPLQWLLYVMSKEGTGRVGSVARALRSYLITAPLVDRLLRDVNALVAKTSKPSPVVLVVDEVQTLGNKMVSSTAAPDGSGVSVMRAVVNAACSLSAAAVWSGTRVTVSDAMSATAAFGKDLPDQRKLMVVGRYAYLDKGDVEQLMNEVLDLSGLSPEVQHQLSYGLQGRARTCAGFVAHLLMSRLARGPSATASLGDEILVIFEEFTEQWVIKRVHSDLEAMKVRNFMRTADIGLLWCRTMLPVTHEERGDKNRFNCIPFTKCVRAVKKNGAAATSTRYRVTVVHSTG
jgi:hypothetical protein